jgi:hypothetical protein
MTSTPNTPNSENKPDWFSKTEHNEESNFDEKITSPKNFSSLKNKVVPIVAGLAIFGAAAAYGFSQKSGDNGGIENVQANQQSAPTIDGGQSNSQNRGVDPDGDNWTGSNRQSPNQQAIPQPSNSLSNNSTQPKNGLPAPTISGGPQVGPGHGVDPDGDNWTGSKRHPEGKFDPNHPRPPHGNDDEGHEGNDD